VRSCVVVADTHRPKEFPTRSVCQIGVEDLNASDQVLMYI
jgi:hypothetical protein